MSAARLSQQLLRGGVSTLKSQSLCSLSSAKRLSTSAYLRNATVAAPPFQRSANLVLENGAVFLGQSFGADRDISGEAV